MAVYNSEGCQGRCDAKCYKAQEEECDCICGGRNHADGKEQALDNTRELAELWLEQARASGQDITHAELAVTAQHEPLFSLREVMS
jgi:predicted RNase H-like HicB family nuclease